MNTHGATVNRGEIVSMYAGLYVSRRSSLTKHVTVYDVTHSRSTKISCLSRLTMSAAYEIPTTSGGSAVDCVLGRFGVFRNEAQ